MADWDDNGVCYIDVVMPLPSCMLEYVMGQWPECFWNRLDSGSLNALLRTNKPLRVLTGGELVKGLTVALKEDSASVAQQASSMRACHLRPTRMKVEGTEESTIALFIEHASPCLGKLGRLQLCAPLLRRGNAVQPTFREGIGKVLLAHVPNLKTLEVGICVATADVVKSLAMISSLEYLSMTVEPEPLAAVTTLSSVRKLHLRVANQSYDVVVEDGLAALANLPNLTDLSLWDVQLGQDTAHALLSHAPRLTALEALLQPPTSSITVGPTLRLLTLIEPTLSTLRHILRSPQCVLVVDGPVSVDSGDTELLASISAADFRLFTELTLCTASGSLESAHLLPALAAGLSTGDCAIKVLVLDDFELEPLAVRDLMRVAPRLVSLKLVCCSVPATALSAALRGGKKLEKLELIDCIDIYPSDMVDLMEELFVLRNDAAPSRLVITAEPDLLHGAVDVAKQRGMWDRERSRQICVLGLKFGV